MKDLFIDTNIASRFTNPLDPEYKKLINWIRAFDINNPSNNAYLVVSKKLLVEYYGSARNANTGTSIPVILDMLVREGRRILITNDQIVRFKNDFFTKKNTRILRSNQGDREHIPVVLLSNRKYALTIDDKFLFDIKNFLASLLELKKDRKICLINNIGLSSTSNS